MDVGTFVCSLLILVENRSCSLWESPAYTRTTQRRAESGCRRPGLRRGVRADLGGGCDRISDLGPHQVHLPSLFATKPYIIGIGSLLAQSPVW